MIPRRFEKLAAMQQTVDVKDDAIKVDMPLQKEGIG